MATASELKVKVTKILTIVEYLEDEHINVIEKDILLQAVRELYSEILVTDTTKPAVENQIQEEEPAEEQPVSAEAAVVENADGVAVAAAVVPPVISVAFDDGEFDLSDLLNVKTAENETENPEHSEEQESMDVVASDENTPQEENIPEEVAEPEAETMESAPEFETEELEGQDAENVEDVDSVDEIENNQPVEESLNLDEDVAPEIHEEVENNEDAVSESEFEKTATGDTEIHYSFNEEPLQEQQAGENVEFVETQPIEEIPVAEEPVAEEPIVEEQQPVDETPAVEPVVEEMPIIEIEPLAEEAPVVEEEPVVQEPVVETQQNLEAKPVEQEKPITLGEQLGQSRQSSLNDRFASNKPLEGSIGLKPVSDIKSAIPLGERFRFTRMLFSGNGPAFDSTVAALNGMSSIEEADNYVRTNFSWDMDSPVVVDFMNIVRRRYL